MLEGFKRFSIDCFLLLTIAYQLLFLIKNES